MGRLQEVVGNFSLEPMVQVGACSSPSGLPAKQSCTQGQKVAPGIRN